jgi:hypothetical protein
MMRKDGDERVMDEVMVTFYDDDDEWMMHEDDLMLMG